MKRFPALPLIFALCACAPRTIALRTTASLLQGGVGALYEEADPELAKDAMGSQLKLLETLLKNEPDNPTLLELAAEGFGGYAFLFIEDAQPERARRFYRRGMAYGLALAARRPALRGLEALPLAALQERLRSAGDGDVPGLFWAAYNWGGWINLSKDDPAAVAGLSKVAAVMRRVEELRPGYYHGGPDLFLGTYYAALPRMLGGDPAKSKRHFEAAERAGGGRFLLAKVLCAKFYAVAAQDQALFKALNEQVLASAETDRGNRLANEVAKLKAKRLMEKINDLF